jgi:mono/diheme cytochrome c family protein
MRSTNVKGMTISFHTRGLMRLERLVALITIICFSASLALTQINENAMQKRRPNVYAALADAPKVARDRKNPFEGNAREAAAGGKLFEEHCSDCHGKKAGGTRRGPSLLREEVQRATPGTLFWTLTNGVVWHGMPVWSKLPEPERWQIVTFLESLHAHEVKPAADGEAGNR